MSSIQLIKRNSLIEFSWLGKSLEVRTYLEEESIAGKLVYYVFSEVIEGIHHLSGSEKITHKIYIKEYYGWLHTLMKKPFYNKEEALKGLSNHHQHAMDVYGEKA